MSSIEKFTFSLSDPDFYEPLDRFALNERIYHDLLREMLPADWHLQRDSIWLHCMPPRERVLAQGWKIHLSAIIPGVPSLLGATVPILVQDAVAFKIAGAPTILSLLVSKQWNRGGAGKFMTVYPRSSEHFLALIEALHCATAGHEGPYILSDRRYKDSKCVFYRYGGIAPRTQLTDKGDRWPYLESPSGERIPDRRQPTFQLPPWVRDPFVPEAGQPAEAKSTPLRNGRYLVEAALRHSNSGGLYLATDATSGKKVVIKEARPFTNVDAFGVESKTLLAKEFRLLTTLEAAGIAPRPLEFFQEWEHHFLVEEFLDGITLRQHSVLHNVTRFSQPPPAHFAEFYEAFKSVFSQLAEILLVFARHHIVFRDLSPTNVIILTTGQVKLVDFEAACELGVDPMSNLFTPGFASSDHFSSNLPQFENDYFSLGALMLAYLMPIHAALGLEPSLHLRFIQSIGEDFGFPESVVNLLSTLMSRDPAERPTPQAVCDGLATPSPNREIRVRTAPTLSDEGVREVIARSARYIKAHASPERTDRLFPCDPKVFATNPLSLAYGACGTAYALRVTTGEVPPAVAGWILEREVSADSYVTGLYMGTAGIAWTLLELGFAERAKQLLAQGAEHPVPPRPDLFYGLAGWGLTHLRFYLAFHEPQYLTAAVSAGDRLVSSRVATPTGCHWGTPDELLFGFAHGASGVSTFLLYLYLLTEDERYLRVGEEALAFDLGQAVDLGEGLLWPSRTGPLRTVVPYWRYGSVGVGAALLRYWQVTRADRYLPPLHGIKTVASRKYAIFPNRAFGLAGLGDFLVDMANAGIDEEECMAAARSVASGIMLFVLDKGAEGVAFPGADLWKISCDYATGSAGIALFLHRMLTRRSADFMLDDLICRFSASRRQKLIATETSGPPAHLGGLSGPERRPSEEAHLT